MQVPIYDIIQCIRDLAGHDRTVLVGIDGYAGSGKTTFTRRLADRLRHLESASPVSVVHTDLIFRTVADRWQGPVDDMPIGYDVDWERLRDHVLRPLRTGETARIQLYDWVEDRQNEWLRIDPGGVIVIDGVFAIRQELVDEYDLRIWFSCPREIRESRLLSRGDTSRAELLYWWPIEDRYVAVQAPEQSAHLVIDGSPDVPSDRDAEWFEAVRWMPPGTDASQDSARQ